MVISTSTLGANSPWTYEIPESIVSQPQEAQVEEEE